MKIGLKKNLSNLGGFFFSIKAVNIAQYIVLGYYMNILKIECNIREKIKKETKENC